MPSARKSQVVRAERSADNAVLGHAQALSRGLALLETLAATERGATLTALAELRAIPAPTAHRLLAALEQEGFVRQDAQGVWTVGVRALQVGAAFLEQRNLGVETAPYLARLMEAAGETANLAVVVDDAAVFIAQVQCRELMRMSVKLGARAPLHASGVGKAMLAAREDAGVTALLGAGELERYTERTVTDRERLQAELAACRKRGYAIDNEEYALGLRCIAAAIYDENGLAWAALSLAGPTSRLTRRRLDSVAALVRKTALDITLALGGQPPRALRVDRRMHGR